MTHRTDEQVEAAVIAAYQEGRTVRLIGEDHGLTNVTVFNILRRAGVPRRRRPGGKRRDFTPEEMRRLKELRLASWSKEELQDEFSCGLDRLNRALADLGLPNRMPRRDRRDRVITRYGYAYVLVDPADPMASMLGKNKYVLEHRLVMARSLGRPLRDGETVHHINGVRDDNRLENLQLRQGRHGKGARWQCADCGSHNLVPVELP